MRSNFTTAKVAKFRPKILLVGAINIFDIDAIFRMSLYAIAIGAMNFWKSGLLAVYPIISPICNEVVSRKSSLHHIIVMTAIVWHKIRFKKFIRHAMIPIAHYVFYVFH